MLLQPAACMQPSRQEASKATPPPRPFAAAAAAGSAPSSPLYRRSAVNLRGGAGGTSKCRAKGKVRHAARPGGGWWTGDPARQGSGISMVPKRKQAQPASASARASRTTSAWPQRGAPRRPPPRAGRPARKGRPPRRPAASAGPPAPAAVCGRHPGRAPAGSHHHHHRRRREHGKEPCF